MKPGDPNPQSLFARALAGDTDALAALFTHYTPDLRRLIARGLPRRHQSLLSIDDCLQQTLVDAFRDFNAFTNDSRTTARSDHENTAAIGAWLATLARRNLVDAVRMLDADKRGRGATASRAQDPADLVDRLTDGRVSRSPRRAAALREAREQLTRALEALPETYAHIIRGYDLDGRPIDELARELGRSRGAAFMLRARALRLLRDRLGSTSKFFSSTA